MNATRSSKLAVMDQGLLGEIDVPAVAPSRHPFTPPPTPPSRKRWNSGFAAALALVVHHGQRASAEPVPTWSRCPRCHHVGRTDEDFGTRVIDGERRPQSWCRTCRASRRSRRPVQQALRLPEAAYRAGAATPAYGAVP